MACCLVAAGFYVYLNKFQEKAKFDISSHVVTGLPEPDKQYGYHNVHANTIIVNGMTCAACSSSVEDVVLGVSGVSACNVSIMDSSVTYVYDPAIYQKDHAAVINAIRCSGFEAHMPSVRDGESTDSIRNVIHGYNQTIECGVYVLGTLGCEKLCLIPFEPMKWMIVLAAVLAVVCQVRQGPRFYKPTWASIKHRRALTMDALVSLSTTIALVLSFSFCIEYLRTGDKQALQNVSFELSTGTLLVISAGRHFEELCKLKLSSQMANLSNLLPRSTLVRQGSKIVYIPCSMIKKNDLLVVMPGSKVPADGIVVEGETYVDELPITGEPVAVKKAVGDHVMAGTLNVRKSIVIQAADKVQSSVVSRLHSLANRQVSTKDDKSQLISRVVSIFTPMIALLSFMTFIYWWHIDPQLARLRALSVVTISCPCALGLAIPAALTRGINVAAKQGCFIRGGGLSRLIDILKRKEHTTVIFDKTGTLTTREVVVTDFEFHEKLNTSEILQFWKLVYSLEFGEEHPIAHTLCAYAKHEVNKRGDRFVSLPNMEYKHIVGGVSCLIDVDGQEFEVKICNQGSKVGRGLFFYINNEEIASCNIKTRSRDDAGEVLRFLNKHDIKVFMATGDKKEPTEVLCKKLDIKDYQYGCTPEQKHELVCKLKTRGPVIMIGDGLNDAGALVEADLAISLATAHQLSVESSQIILMNDRLTSICDLFSIAKQTDKIIQVNILSWIMYNSIMIPLAMGFLSRYGVCVSPAWSATLMSLSSVFVLSNSLWIK